MPPAYQLSDVKQNIMFVSEWKNDAVHNNIILKNFPYVLICIEKSYQEFTALNRIWN